MNLRKRAQEHTLKLQQYDRGQPYIAALMALGGALACVDNPTLGLVIRGMGMAFFAGVIYRTRIIQAGREYLSKNDVHRVDSQQRKALQAGTRAKTWAGYAQSFGEPLTYLYSREFNAGMAHARVGNHRIVAAITTKPKMK